MQPLQTCQRLRIFGLFNNQVQKSIKRFSVLALLIIFEVREFSSRDCAGVRDMKERRIHQEGWQRRVSLSRDSALPSLQSWDQNWKRDVTAVTAMRDRRHIAVPPFLGKL
jgi:hypothetical protein